MKRSALLLFFVLSLTIKSQVVFCPPGAEWHYTFSEYWPKSGIVNEKISYVGDIVEGIDTLKVLNHIKFYTELNMNIYGPTHLKKRADTIYMRNSRTQNSWEILYNFACPAGQSWVTEIVDTDNTSPRTYTVTVDSIKQELVNGFNLKVMFVRYSNMKFSQLQVLPATITERFGCDNFMFNYISHRWSDGDRYIQRLCYKDNAFGLEQFTSKPCDYSNLTGIKENGNNEIKLFPNPAQQFIDIEFASSNIDFSIKLLDLPGKEIILPNCSKIQTGLKLDLSHLTEGVYFLQVFEQGNLISTKKIIKE